MDYYEECIRNVLEDYYMNVPDACINDMVEALHACDEYASYSAGGYNPQTEAFKKLESELEREKNKVICGRCHGKGILIDYGPSFTASTNCHECGGSGYKYGT